MFTESLRGIRVLDFSQIVAGPVCGMTLADLGADVVKIEAPGGELGRQIGPPWLNGESVVSLSVNRNKRGLAIDLKTAAGRALVHRLVKDTDVVVESFRPGVMDRLGIGAATLREINPRLIVCSISAYGQSGPWKDQGGVDGIVQAVSGLMNTMGEPGGGPVKMAIPVADMVTGYLATISVLGALFERSRTGLGQALDVSLFGATLMLQQVGLAFFMATGREPDKTGSAAPYAAPNEAYPTADGWIMIAAYQPKRWIALCAALQSAELANDERFATASSRVAHRGALFDAISSHTRQQTTDEWCAALSAADILCAPLNTYARLVESPPFVHARATATFTHPFAGEVDVPAFCIGAPDTRVTRVAPAPLAGQHGREVLAEHGLQPAEIDALLASGAVRLPELS